MQVRHLLPATGLPAQPLRGSAAAPAAHSQSAPPRPGTRYPRRTRKVAISMGSRRMVVLLEAVPSGYIRVSEVGCREPSSSPWNRLPSAS